MSKEKDEKQIDSLVEEINVQDLDEKAGAGYFSAVKLTAAGKCGTLFTVSYECTSPNKACG
jgi:hypothetical protein